MSIRENALVACAVALAVACGGAGTAAAPGTSAAASPAAATPAPGAEPIASASPTAPPTAAASPEVVAPTPSSATAGRRLGVADARRYMVSLINRDRARHKLPPVELDEGAPTAAGQSHAEDMARLGFLGHWGSDGSVPEQRHSEKGGADMVMENALCFTDLKARKLDPNPTIEALAIERAESAFYDEVPPNDGHRQNILKPFHKRVGIGVAQPLGTTTEIAVPCFAQEFTDPYGHYGAAPANAKVGSMLHAEGTVDAPATFAGVGLARVDAPHALSPSELNTRRSYAIPQPYQMYWPPGFKTPIPVKVEGNRFSVDLPLDDHGKAGLYELSVWGKVPGATQLTMISLRTLRVDR